MSTNGLSAFLLHQKPAKNTTTQVFVLTQARGLLRAFCAGGAGLKKRAILQPFTPLWLTLNERAYGTYLNQVEIADAPIRLVGGSLLAGLYLNELLYRALKPDLSDVRLFLSYQEALQALQLAAHQQEIEVILRQFERMLLDVSGYQISYVYEAVSQTPILEGTRYAFLPGDGFIQDDQGFLGEYILAMGQNHLDNAVVLKVAKWVMRRAIDHFLDGEMIQTRVLYCAQ